MKVTWPTNAATSTRSPKVFVGLSGGVDSAVSAALLQSQGYAVTGVFIRITIDGYPCTAGEDKLDAMRVAAHLKIPFREIDLSEAYTKRVFEISVREFEKGRTPNPDILCNREIKFGLFYDYCMAEGADFVATGHYAQIKNGELHKGADPEKDQSYFLWAVPQEKLRRTVFPVGGYTKKNVRALAERFGLPNATRKDSQGLCFLGPISISEMLQRELALTPGVVLNEQGAPVGTHEGAAAYTLGQRHGYSLSAHAPDTRPHFVVGKDSAANTITVSTERFPKGTHSTEIQLSEVNWIGKGADGEVLARYRYRQQLISATLRREDATVILHEPHFAPEGQSLVLYQGTRCLGGGVILTSRYGDTHRKS
jgi:tRNA-uridine 2-sulfurtransferase